MADPENYLSFLFFFFFCRGGGGGAAVICGQRGSVWYIYISQTLGRWTPASLDPPQFIHKTRANINNKSYLLRFVLEIVLFLTLVKYLIINFKKCIIFFNKVK